MQLSSRFLIFLCCCCWAISQLEAAAPAPRALQTQALLQAMALESQGDYAQAEAALLGAKIAGPTVEQHLFALRLLQGKAVTPQTPEQHRLAAQYLQWRNDEAGLERLLAQVKIKDPFLRLAEAELRLHQGRWAEAEGLLKQENPTTRLLQQEQQLLQFWLLLLQEKNPEAQALWNKMNGENLMQETGHQDLERGTSKLEELAKANLLHPKDAYFRERLLAALLQDPTQAAQANRLGLDFPLPPQIKTALPRLRGYLRRQGPPQAYDLWIRHFWLYKDWNSMAQLAQDYQDKFPELRDGQWYQQQAQAAATRP